MNQGIIVTRYARSLVKYCRETGGGAVAVTETEILLKALHDVQDLRRMLSSRDVLSPADKRRLLVSAAGGKLSDEMDRFLSLVIRSGRIDMLEDILRAFVKQYYGSQGIVHARLLTVEDPPESLLQRLRDLVRARTGAVDVRIDLRLDPSLLGGFVFDMDDHLLDASVKRQLDIIKEQFIERNRRIV